MGIRGELFSTRFACEGRTYFFNVKQNRNGDVFLSIVESKPSEGESFDRRSIVVFGETMEGFLKSFQSALKFMDETGNKVDPDPTASSRYEEDERLRSKSEPPKRRAEGQRSERSGSFHDGPKPEGRPMRKYTLKPRDGFPRESTARESAPREGFHKESSPRIGAARIGTPRISSPRTGASREISPREGAPRDGGPRRPTAEPRSRQDKPVKRIVVRRAKSQDGEA